ncbi:transcription initiation factor IIB [Coemansia sp. RSA 1939]|nr:transcription initiation factor IIB [Coemansia sp. RSA 1939]KAJ2695297.1 transcription initiation factor IIB [Coemansia sp. RSA 1285]
MAFTELTTTNHQHQQQDAFAGQIKAVGAKEKMAAAMAAMAAAVTTTTSSPSGGFTAICPNCRADDADLVHDFKSGEIICGGCNLAVSDRLILSPCARGGGRQAAATTATTAAATLLSMAGGSGCRAQPTGTTTSVSSSQGSSQSGPDDSDASTSNKAAGVPTRAQRSRGGGRKAGREAERRRERGLERAYEGIRQMCANMDVPAGVDEAARAMYRRLDQDRVHRGKSIEATVATCIFVACRQLAVPRTFKEICALTRVPRKEISRMFKVLKERLGEDDDHDGGSGCAGAGLMRADDLLARFCSTLSLGRAALRCAALLSAGVRHHDTLAGKSPVSVASACIYMAAHLVRQPRDEAVISHVAGISEGTIRSSYRLMFADRRLLVSRQLLDLVPSACPDLLLPP